MVQFLPLLLTHSIRLYMDMSYGSYWPGPQIQHPLTMQWTLFHLFERYKVVKQNHPKRTEKKKHQTHQTLSKKKSKHVKSIQVIHVYITVHVGFWSHPSLPIFCNSAWHSWWRHARWHAWHSWRYHTPEAISNGAAVVWIKGNFQNTTQPFVSAHGPRLGSLQDLQRWKFSRQKKCYNISSYRLQITSNWVPPTACPEVVLGSLVAFQASTTIS